MNQLCYCSPTRGQRVGFLRSCTEAFIIRESKFKLPFYAKDSLNLEGHIWLPVPARLARVPSPSLSHACAQPAGCSCCTSSIMAACVSGFKTDRGPCGAASLLPPRGPLVDQVKAAASLNVELRRGKEHLAVFCTASVYALFSRCLPRAMLQHGGETGRVPCLLGSQPGCHLKVLLVEVEFDLPGIQAGVLVARLLQALCQGPWPAEEHADHRPVHSTGASALGKRLRGK